MKRFITDAGGSTDKLKLALSLQATIRGIPQIYSGDEIAMPGDDDPDNRRDFPGGFPGDPQNAFTQAGRNAQQQDVYSHLQSLLKLRGSHPALRLGIQKHVVVADDYYLFTRETNGERLLIAFYKGDASKGLTVDLAETSIANAAGLSPLFGSSTAQLSGKQIQLQLQPMTLTVWTIRN